MDDGGTTRPPAAPRSRARHLVPLVLLVAGLLFATGAGSAAGDAGGRAEDLPGLVARENAKVDAYNKQVLQLQRDNDRAAAARNRDDAVTARAQRAAGAAGKKAGLRPVKGSGLKVTLDDAPRAVAAAEDDKVPPDYLVVHQQDVQAVVNALWAGGATAVQVMDQRLVATSAVRCVGNTLLLQGRVYSPPFTVTAVGPVDRMQAALDREPGIRVYRQYVDRYQLGYKVQRLSTVTVPGYDSTLDLKHAQPYSP